MDTTTSSAQQPGEEPGQEPGQEPLAAGELEDRMFDAVRARLESLIGA